MFTLIGFVVVVFISFSLGVVGGMLSFSRKLLSVKSDFTSDDWDRIIVPAFSDCLNLHKLFFKK